MNKRYVILAAIFIVLIIGVVILYSFFKKSEVVNNKIANDLNVVKEIELPTNLLFTPTEINVSNNQIFSSGVNISTGSIVTGIDIELVYDPSVVQVKKINPISLLGSFVDSSNWQVIKNEIDNKNGNARFTAFTVDRNFGITGRTDILEIQGMAKRLGDDFESYQIDFGQFTVISALNKGYNVLTQRIPLTLVFSKK